MADTPERRNTRDDLAALSAQLDRMAQKPKPKVGMPFIIAAVIASAVGVCNLLGMPMPGQIASKAGVAERVGELHAADVRIEGKTDTTAAAVVTLGSDIKVIKCLVDPRTKAKEKKGCGL
jgi:hypothetical protein